MSNNIAVDLQRIIGRGCPARVTPCAVKIFVRYKGLVSESGTANACRFTMTSRDYGPSVPYSNWILDRESLKINYKQQNDVCLISDDLGICATNSFGLSMRRIAIDVPFHCNLAQDTTC